MITRFSPLVFVALFLTTQAHAEMKPVVLPATYSEPEPPKAAEGAPPPALVPVTCALAVMDLADERSTPDYMGSFFDQPFQPPTDRAAWVRSMVEGLSKRGVAVSFPDKSTVTPVGALPAKISLQTAWLDYSNGGFYGTVRLHLTSLDASRPLDKVWRGTYWRTLFMATVGGRAADALNGGVAATLDKLAKDLLPICKG